MADDAAIVVADCERMLSPASDGVDTPPVRQPNDDVDQAKAGDITIAITDAAPCGEILAAVDGNGSGVPIPLLDCAFCLEPVAELVAWSGACKLCTLRDIRRQLDPTVNNKAIVSQAEQPVPLDMATLDGIRAWRDPPPGGPDQRPLSDAEYKRAQLWVMTATYPLERFASCPNDACTDTHLLLPSMPPTASPCGTCGTNSCGSCGSAWVVTPNTAMASDAGGSYVPPSLSVSHEDTSCAAFAAIIAGLTQDDTTALQGLHDYKRCPECGEGMSHYRGHACHHMVPGQGCPTCMTTASRTTHFCYVCLDPWPHPYAGTAAALCPLYCTPACDCADCNVCVPPKNGAAAIPCSQCSGAGSGCRVCAGADTTSPAAIEAWQATQAAARAALLQRGWCGPRTARRLSSVAAAYAGVGARGREDREAMQTLTSLCIDRTTTPQALVSGLHAATVLCARHIGDRQHREAVETLRPLASAVIPYDGTVDGRDALEERLASVAVCEGILEFMEVMLTPPPTTATTILETFTNYGGFRLLYAVLQRHRDTAVVAQRVFSVIAAATRLGMLSGSDLPQAAEAMFDAADGLATTLAILATAHSITNAVVVTSALKVLGGTRIHTAARVAAVREGGAIAAILRVVFAPYGQAVHVAAAVALARVLEGLRPTWSDVDEASISATVELLPDGAVAAALTHSAANINAYFGTAMEMYQEQLTLGEAVILAGALMRIHKGAGPWWRGRSEALARVLSAFPPPPVALASEAVTIRASTLRRLVANEYELRAQLERRRAAERADAALPRPPLWVQILVSPLALVWLLLRALRWVVTRGLWVVFKMLVYGVRSLPGDGGRIVYYLLLRPLWRYVLLPTGRFLHAYLLVPLHTAAVWLTRHLLLPVARGVRFGCVTLGMWSARAGNAIWRHVLTPLGHGISQGSAWVWNHTLVPVGHGLAWCGHQVARGIRATWDHVFVPLGRGIAWTGRQIGRGISWLATQLWRFVFVPIGEGIAWAGRQIGRGISWLATQLWRFVLVPLGRGISWIVRHTWKWIIVPLARGAWFCIRKAAKGLWFCLYWLAKGLIWYPLYYAYVLAKRIAGIIWPIMCWVGRSVLLPVVEALWYATVVIGSAIGRAISAVGSAIGRTLGAIAGAARVAMRGIGAGVAAVGRVLGM